MGKPQNLGHLAHIVTYDSENHITVPAGITMHTNQLVASQAWVTTALGSYALSSSLGSYVPTSRTITINGTSYDLSANRSWDITSMIYPAAGIPLSTGTAWGTSITNNSANWNTAYGWGNHASAGYASSSHNHNGTYWPIEGSWKPASLSSSTRLIGKTSPDGGEFGLAYSGGQIHAYTDGFFYQNEGQYRVIDSNSISSQSVSYATSAGNASTVGGKSVGNSTNNIAYFDASRNLYVNNPEEYSGEVRLGAAWGRGGVYASGTLSLSTSSSNIHFVFGNSVPIAMASSGSISLGGGANEPISITGSAHKYITINPGNGYEAMVRYIGGSGSGWYVGKRTSGQLIGTQSFHFYSEESGQTVCGINPSGNMSLIGGVYASGLLEVGPNSGADKGIGILYGTGEYGRIRFYQDGRNNHSTIHSFGSGWQGGNVNTSGGAINVDGQYGVTIGAWNAPTMIIAKSGPVTVNTNLATTGEIYSGYQFKCGSGSDTPYLNNPYGADHWRAAGSAWFTYGPVGSTNFFSTSRRAVKTQIQSFNRSAVDLINTVDIVEYNYKNDLNNKRIGFIAEDTIAEIATESHDQMDINSSIGLLLKAVQELSSENKQIRIELNQLKTT